MAVLSIDQGTTSSRALVISEANSGNPEIISLAQKEFKQIFPEPGWVEHDPEEIWSSTLEVSKEAVSKANEKISSIAITNQRETTILWDKNTGKPVYNAIVWQCRRTSDYCQELKADTEFSDYVREKTGLLIDSYFSGPKISWILKHLKNSEPEKYTDEYIKSNLCFGTVDTWLLWNLSEAKTHLTEASNASRTMLYDIHSREWDKKILERLEIPEEILPKVVASNSKFSEVNLFKDELNTESIPVKAILGDQQAALYAYSNDCEGKITYGTGAFILVPGNQMIDGLLSTVVTDDGNAISYALEGSIFIAGSIVQWLRDGLGIIESSSEVEALAKSVEDNGGVYIIPALTGLGAPQWREDLRGSIHGISRGSTKAHIARAALESIAFQVKDVFNRIKTKPKYLCVDGGASKNDLLMQFQADLLGIELKRFTETEMTALGVARMTGDLNFSLKADKSFKPSKNLDEKYEQWQAYLKQVLA